ncbi:Os12g0264500, partial [Oryza sativa Japonica Group]
VSSQTFPKHTSLCYSSHSILVPSDANYCSVRHYYLFRPINPLYGFI